MDAYTIAFGIRNVTHIDAALDEAFRVGHWSSLAYPVLSMRLLRGSLGAEMLILGCRC